MGGHLYVAEPNQPSLEQRAADLMLTEGIDRALNTFPDQEEMLKTMYQKCIEWAGSYNPVVIGAAITISEPVIDELDSTHD